MIVTEDHVKDQIIERFKQFPVMNRSMLGVTLIKYRALELSGALNDLVCEGRVVKADYVSHRRISSLYFLAEDERLLRKYVARNKS